MGALNRVIEEVAYKQVEDMIVMLEMLSEQIIKTSKDARTSKIDFGTPSGSNDEMNKKLLESEAITKRLQKQYTDLQKSYTDLVNKVDKYTTAKKNNTTALTNNSISQSQLLKNVKEEEVLTSSLTTYIQKLSVERIRASRVVADYNAMVALGITLTEEQKIELDLATASFRKYDAAIKAGKTSIGDAREYVGQYERANIGLSNSVAQIARELPAATYGFQTFALGVSNNIPIFVDEVKKAVEINKQLVAQGKETTSVFKQVGSAIFSFNTIMSIGILLFTLYGKEIASATKELFGFGDALNDAKKQLDLVHEATEDFNRIGVESTTMYEKQYQKLKQLIAVMKDETKTDIDRKSARQELEGKYPGYFKNLTNEELLLGNVNQQTSNYSKALRQLTADLKLRADAEAKQGKAQNTLKLAAELQEEVDLRRRANQEIFDQRLKYDDSEGKTTESLTDNIKKRQKLVEEDAKFIEKFGTIGTETSGSVNRLGLYTDSQINELEEKSRRLLDVYQTQQEEASKLFVQTSLLDVKDKKDKDENTKSIKLNTKAREDYLASLAQLQILRLTNVMNANKEIMDDEASGYEIRFAAAQQYYGNLVDLANMEANEELRVLKFSTEDKLRQTENEFSNQKDQLDKYLKDEKISKSDHYKAMKDAEDQFNYDITGIKEDAVNKQNIIFENQAEKLVQANLEMVNKLREQWDSINFKKANIEIDERDLAFLEKAGDALKGIDPNAGAAEIKQKLADLQRLEEDHNAVIKRANLQVELDTLESTKRRIEAEIEERGKAKNLSADQIAELKVNNKALLDLDDEIINKKKQVTAADNEATQKQIDNAVKLKEAKTAAEIQLGNDIGALANQLLENAAGDYDHRIEQSNAYYDALLENAEKGSEQEKLLQDEKKRAEDELQKKRIDILKKQAIFNKFLQIADIGIKLQGEISKNNVELGTIPAQPVNAFAIASAAIRTATVLATPLPQYEDGTDYHKGGKALVGEKRTEVVENPDGSLFLTPNTPTVVDLKTGAKVYKSLEEFNKQKTGINNAAILASLTNGSDQLQRFDMYLGRELNGLPDRIEKGIERGFKKVKINNNISTQNYDYQHHIYSNTGFRA